MPFPPLDAWDDTTLDEVSASDETAILEKKAAEKFDPKGQETRSEIAKQLSAFANTGNGFLVFGVDKTGKLDDGVPEFIGREPVKAWAEALVPKLVEPAAVGVQARFLHRPGHHKPGFGVLAIEIPLSDARPHWVRGTPDIAYLRVGEHSFPMPTRTLLDMASRQGGSIGEVYNLHVSGLTWNKNEPHPWNCRVNPYVGLVSGSFCKDWAVQLSIDPGVVEFGSTSTSDYIDREEGTLLSTRTTPLFPGHRARLYPELGASLLIKSIDDAFVKVTLFAGSALPVTRWFAMKDLRTGDAAHFQSSKNLLPAKLHSGLSSETI